jgi:hypothetical protein
VTGKRPSLVLVTSDSRLFEPITSIYLLVTVVYSCLSLLSFHVVLFDLSSDRLFGCLVVCTPVINILGTKKIL